MAYTFTFSDQTTTKLEQAAKVFDLKDSQSVLDFMSILLDFAVAAKKQGRDLAVIQDIRRPNKTIIYTDEILDLGSVTEAVSGVNMHSIPLINTTFITPSKLK